MAFIEKTMFEVTVSNSTRNGTQHVAGKFGTYAANSYTPKECSAGLLCTEAALIPSEGYEGIVNTEGTPRILNGNAWYMIAAESGTSGGMRGDHTGIYAFDNYDVNKVTSGNLQYNLGVNTLGVGLPAGNIGDFCELIVGEQYTFGAGNFSAVPTAAQTYATIANGMWTPSATAPAAGAGVYAQIMRTKPINEGTIFWGDGYVLKIMRAADATA